MSEYKKITKKEHDEFYNLKKDELLKAVKLFEETDDVNHIVDMFEGMVVMCRCAGMTLNEIERFIQLKNRGKFANAYFFTKHLKLYKDLHRAL